MGAEHLPELLEQAMAADAVVIGPGLSSDPESLRLAREFIVSAEAPLVIDGDALTALAGREELCREREYPTCLTPHPGEMARLTGIANSDIQADRVGVAGRFAQDHGCHLVLKGARSLIARPDGRIHVNPTGNPALACGGSGDVLTGLVGAFLARGMPPEKAAMSGVYLHGLAADFLAEGMGEAGILAGDLPEVIPSLIAALAEGEWPLESDPPETDFYYPL